MSWSCKYFFYKIFCLQGIALKDDDELISVKLTDGEDNVVMVTKRRSIYTYFWYIYSYYCSCICNKHYIIIIIYQFYSYYFSCLWRYFISYLWQQKIGIIKKTPLSEYDSSRKTGLQGIALKDDDDLVKLFPSVLHLFH